MKPIFWPILIFVCAASFRLTNMDLIEFKLDEARDVYEMVLFYKDPYLFARGTIQSTGVYNPPLWYYILALISLPSRDPQYLSFMIALLNSAAVVGFYWVVNKFYGQFAGVLAGLLLAFSPWAIIFSRKIWAPDLILPFAVGIFYFLHIIYQGRTLTKVRPLQKWAWFWLVLLLSLLAQLHASGIFLAVAVILCLLIFRVRFKILYCLFGLLLGLIPLIPYLAYQFGSECTDCEAFSEYGQIEKSFNPIAFLRPFEFINGSSFNLILGQDFQQFPAATFFIILFMLEFILLPVGVYYILKQEKKYGFLFIFLAAVPFLIFVTATAPHLYYFLIISPYVLVIYSIGIWGLGKFRWVVAGIILTVNIIFNLLFYNFLYQGQTVNGDYGVTYKVSKEMAEEALAPYKGSPDYELIKAEYFIKLFSNSL